MDIKDRIRRRQRATGATGLIREYEAISPVSHLAEPIGRSSTLEQLLDALEPSLNGSLPPDTYVWGPSGSGKSAVISALFDRLETHVGSAHTPIGTTTRAEPGSRTSFVYVNARRAKTEFGLYRSILNGMLDERIPEQGVGTATLRDRLEDALSTPRKQAVVAVDHLGEPETYSLADLEAILAAVDGSLAWVAVGRDPPGDLAVDVPSTVHVAAYERHGLVDVLTERASDGLSSEAASHAQIRYVADWAAGDAHAALAALFGAAELATDAGHDRLTDADIDSATEAVPRPSVALGRVLALPRSRQLVLRELLEVDDSLSVDETAEAIASRRTVDLSAGTVTRYLYELADAGILERVTAEGDSRLGRPPSRVEPRFPTLVFRELFDSGRET